MKADFATRYGPWAIIAGASAGLGAAFARALARRKVNLLLIARNPEPLEKIAAECRADYGIETRILTADSSSAAFGRLIDEAAAGLEVGLAVYNAAHAPIGPFIDSESDSLVRVADTNVRGPLILAHRFLPPMVERGRGGLILMSSLAGLQGSPRLAAYAASKAFNRILAEGLWHEVKKSGVDVLACCAGAIATPGFAGSSSKSAPGTLDPGEVAELTLKALERRKGPMYIPGLVNKLAAFTLSRCMSRRAAISLMALNTRDLHPAQPVSDSPAKERP